ncbi:hypothetical protein A9Q82_06030 [Cycloclasticus sp. 46_120_T64]|nr:hypothetical protein A9Q82_06030 [Cycloclasticus sp. 46_120_T64]
MNNPQKYPDELNEILENLSVKKIINEVETLYEGKSLEIIIAHDLDSHGGFHWEAEVPTISVNPRTGINKSNICHELIHATQFKKGFPFIRSNIYKDKRGKVVQELVSNLLHINLVKEFNNREISVEEYLSPTIDQIKKELKKRKKKEVKTIPFLRIHYDALVFLRIFYEGKYLSSQEKNYIKLLFKKFSPTAYDLTFELMNIINKSNPTEPEGCALALLDCLNFLNGSNVTRKIPDFMENQYVDSLNELKDKYHAHI